MQGIKQTKRININAEHSYVKELPKKAALRLFRTRARIIARKSKINPIATYSTAHTLAHLLFPKNFPQIIATGLKGNKQKHSATTFSKKITLTPRSQEGIDNFYIWRNTRKIVGKDYEETLEEHNSDRELIKRFYDAGIEVNPFHMNIGRTKKSTVFFEIDFIDTVSMRKYIEKLPQDTAQKRLKKAQAMELLKNLTKFTKRSNIIDTHIKSQPKIKV